MYTAMVFAHSWLRWLVLILAAIAVGRALRGLVAGSSWQRYDDVVGRWFVVSLDVQVLVGLTLSFVLSPITTAFWSDVSEAMGNSALRFIALEHLTGMLAAAVLAHIGRVRVRRRTQSLQQHRQALIFYGVSLLLILLSIPWPFMEAGAPLFRWL